MKYEIYLLSVMAFFSLQSCDTGSNLFKTVNEVKQTEAFHLLHHNYAVRSERPDYRENAYLGSEFEFIKSENEVKLLLVINSLRTASPLQKEIMVLLDNKEMMTLVFTKVNVENTTATSSSSSQTPRFQSVTVCVPESKHEITKSDGSKETVTIPATTKSESVTVYDNTTTNETNYLRRDEAIVELNSLQCTKLKNATSVKFKIYYENHGVWLMPYTIQLNELKSFL